MVARRFIKHCLQANVRNKIDQMKREERWFEQDINNYTVRLNDNKLLLKDAKRRLEELQKARFLTGKFEYAQGVLNNAIELVNHDVRAAENGIQYVSERIETAKSNLKLMQKSIKEATAEIDNVSDKDIDKIEEEIKNIETIKTVENVNINEKYIDIWTKELIIAEPVYGENFFLGKCNICIPLNMDDINNIRVYANRQVCAYNVEMNHPHIFNSGNACWGNVTDTLIYAFANKSFYLTALTVLSFLQTCDIKDEAGKFVPTWGKQLADGTFEPLGPVKYYGRNGQILIRDNYEDEEEGQCDCCDEWFGVDSLLTCDCCGGTFCTDCCREYDTIEGFVYLCDDCRNDYYKTCHHCGGLERESRMTYIENLDRWVCNDCLEEYYGWNAEEAAYELVNGGE